MPAAGLTLHPQPCLPIATPDPARVRALLLPAGPRRPSQIIPVELSSSAISDISGDALITGLDGMGQDTDVPDEVATAAYHLRILPDRRCPDTHHQH